MQNLLKVFAPVMLLSMSFAEESRNSGTLSFVLPEETSEPSPFDLPNAVKAMNEIPVLMKEADRGNSNAMYELGLAHSLIAEEFVLIRKRAEADINEFRKLGGVPYNFESLKQRIANAAQAAEDNHRLSENWFRKAVDNHHLKSHVELARLRFEEGRDAEAIELLDAVREGLPSANNLLGWAYEEGRGVEQNFASAFKHFHEAAEGGDLVAMSNVAGAYYYGNGTKKNPQAALRWYLKAGESGESGALLHAALMLHSGTGVDRNLKRALELFRKAGNAGIPDAMFWYATIAFEHQAFEEALQWYAAGVRSGHVPSMTMAGICFYRGLGTDVNRFVANQLWTQATDAGGATAAKLLAKSQRQELFDFQDSATLEEIWDGREFLRLKQIE